MIHLHHSDLALWLGLGISICVLNFLQTKRLATKEPILPSPEPQQIPTVDDVESIHLFNLTRHPNGKIASTATRILCRRALNDPATRRAIHQDAHSTSLATRSRAEKAIRLIRSFDDTAFSKHDVDHLEKCMALNDDGNGSTGEANESRRGVDYQPENLLELWDRQSRESNVRTESESNLGRNGTPRPRNRESSPGERARRRRRREAIVLNEGDHPVSQHDIIQRRQT